MTLRNVLDIRDGDSVCPVLVPDTEYVIYPPGFDEFGSRVERAGAVDLVLSDRMRAKFWREIINVATMRRIAGWLREGAP